VTDLETQLRSALNDLAEEVRPAPLLARLDQEHDRSVRRHRLTVAAVAAAVVTVLTAGSLVVLRIDRPSIVEPVQRPPKIFRLSDQTSASPGRVDLAVSLASVREAEDKPAYLHPATGTAAVRLPGSDVVSWSWTQHLSADGTRYVRQENSYSDPLLEIVDLRTGRSDDLGGAKGYCPELSPDNGRVAYYSNGAVRVLDVQSRSSRPLRRVTVGVEFPCGGWLAWSPDGDLLAIGLQTGTVLVDRGGQVVLRLPGMTVTNGSMSWSPDGRLILLYERATGSYVVMPADGGPPRALDRPQAAIEPMGWVGQRIGWLSGPPGEQSVVTTDQEGTQPRTWMRFDVGDRPVESVQWSRDLAGYGRG